MTRLDARSHDCTGRQAHEVVRGAHAVLRRLLPDQPARALRPRRSQRRRQDHDAQDDHGQGDARLGRHLLRQGDQHRLSRAGGHRDLGPLRASRRSSLRRRRSRRSRGASPSSSAFCPTPPRRRPTSSCSRSTAARATGSRARTGIRSSRAPSSILAGLGFSVADFDRDVSEFSGGWQMRIQLSKLLLRHPDLLLLDEPTNHLDLASVRWLESFLTGYDGAVLIVSHDRAFLDGMVNHVAAIEHGKLTVYVGNYSSYIEQREAAARAAPRRQGRAGPRDRPPRGVHREVPLQGHQGAPGPGPRQEAREDHGRAHRAARAAEARALPLPAAAAHLRPRGGARRRRQELRGQARLPRRRPQALPRPAASPSSVPTAPASRRS